MKFKARWSTFEKTCDAPLAQRYSMKVIHHGLEIDIDDTWLSEAGLRNFSPTSQAYRVDSAAANGRRIFQVSIASVRPISLTQRRSVFKDGKDREGTAKDRVMHILRGFASESAIPPVEVVPDTDGTEFQYKLTHGVHRFYCALAAGYTHVPAVQGYELGT